MIVWDEKEKKISYEDNFFDYMILDIIKTTYGA